PGGRRIRSVRTRLSRPGIRIVNWSESNQAISEMTRQTWPFNTYQKSKILTRPPSIALLPWGNVLEDFIDKIGVSLEAFCKEFTGSWMFGYADALRRVGVRTVLICMSSRVGAPKSFEHAPSGATICILPASRIYCLLRRRIANPYGRTVRQAFANLA